MKINEAFRNDSLKILFNAIAARDGISVVFDKTCEVPNANSKGLITLPSPSAVDAHIYWFYAMHELGHLLREMDWTYQGLPKKIDYKDELARSITNILIDYLEEKSFYGNYEGVDSILNVGRNHFIKKYCKMSNDKVAAHKESAPGSLLLSLVMAESELRQEWMGHLVEALPISEFNKKHFAEFSQAYVDINLKTRLNSILSSKDPVTVTVELVKDILAIISHKLPPSPEDGECEECKGTGKGKDGEPCKECGSEPCEACEGTGSDEDGEPCKECEGAGESVTKLHDTGDPAREDEGIGKVEASWTKTMEDLTPEQLTKLLEAIRERVTEIPDKPFEKIHGSGAKYIPWSSHTVHELEKDHPNYRPYMREAIASALGTSAVSKQIAKYLKAMVTESFTYGQKRGKLHQKNIHRLIGQKPMPGVSPSIFKKRNSSILKTDSAVSIVLDCSGSMSGARYFIGAACCVALSETLTGLGIIHEILGFTEDLHLESYVFKNFNTTFTKDKVLNVMANEKIRLMNNADGESVLWAAERLAKRKERSKLMIVLSDGYPSGCYTGDGHAYLKYVCELIEKQSPIDLVGIGISTTAVERFYSHYVIVNNPKDLDEVLFGVLKRFLT